jgi:hypothetical protein
MPIDDSRTVSEVTRRNIFDALTNANFAWWGRLSVTEFLGRLFDLKALPSTDHRSHLCPTALEDVTQHCERNDDWEIDWLFYDDRFQLFHGNDAGFFKFLAETAHPVVQADAKKVEWLVDTCNQHLAADGWVMAKKGEISGRPTFEVQRNKNPARDDASMSKPDESSTASHVGISQRTVVALRECLATWTLQEIRNLFDSTGVPLSEDFQPQASGQRRCLAMKYLHSLDLAKPSDVQRLLSVFEYVLERLTHIIIDTYSDAHTVDEAQRVFKSFLPLLHRDGFDFQNGRVLPLSQSTLLARTAMADLRTPEPRVTEHATPASNAPTVFVSYSWDSDEHKLWVRELALKLRSQGVDVKLDHWELAPGDGLPHFMETGVRTNRFVLIILTPDYKRKSDNRHGGVGYEGNIITAELFAGKDPRKFIPVLREASWVDASPSWLSGKVGVDLRGTPYLEEQFTDLLATVHGMREKAPPLGPPPSQRTVMKNKEHVSSAPPSPPEVSEPIRIVNIIASEVGTPRDDGTQGSALYAVPFQLSRRPSTEWVEHFINTWRMSPSSSTRHRPSIARVEGDRLILDGTTIEEVAVVHRDTLKVVLEKVNIDIAEHERRQRQLAEQKAEQLRQHQQLVDDIAKRISFD